MESGVCEEQLNQVETLLQSVRTRPRVRSSDLYQKEDSECFGFFFKV